MQGVRKRFGQRTVLHGVDLEVGPGETVAMLGRNGSGKTTSLRIAAGLLSADAGWVAIAGEPVWRRRRGPVRVGYCPQENVLYPELSVEENLRFVARLYGVPRPEESTRVAWVLNRLGLRGLEEVRAEELSGGQKRRLTIGTSTLHRPDLLLIEEPEAGVDPQSRELVVNFLKEAGKEAAILLTSHDPDVVRQMARRAVLLDQGVIAYDGRPREVLRRLRGVELPHMVAPVPRAVGVPA